MRFCRFILWCSDKYFSPSLSCLSLMCWMCVAGTWQHESPTRRRCHSSLLCVRQAWWGRGRGIVLRAPM
jgi:hypothetical protein